MREDCGIEFQNNLNNWKKSTSSKLLHNWPEYKSHELICTYDNSHHQKSPNSLPYLDMSQWSMSMIWPLLSILYSPIWQPPKKYLWLIFSNMVWLKVIIVSSGIWSDGRRTFFSNIMTGTEKSILDEFVVPI